MTELGAVYRYRFDPLERAEFRLPKGKSMRRSHWLRVLFCAIVVGAVLPLGTTRAAMQPATPGQMTIADPRVDPGGTLRDAMSIAQTTPPVAGPLEATGDIESSVPEYLSSGVQLGQFFAQYSFVVPASPNQDWMVAFTFWDDGRGNYYDLSIISDPGDMIWGLGITQNYKYDIDQTGKVEDAQSFDVTPGAVNVVSLVYYDGVVIMAGNGSILAQVDVGVRGSGDVRAKVAWSAGRGTPAPPVEMSISNFSVWELPSDGVMPAGAPNQGGPTPSATPVQTPGALLSIADQTSASSPTAAPEQLTPASVSTPSEAEATLWTEVFEKERADALTGQPIWHEQDFPIWQIDPGSFDVAPTDQRLRDFYAIATFVNPDDLATASDFAIGFRDNNDNRDFRFVIDTNGAWSVFLGNTTYLASGTVAVDGAAGASITLEVVAVGATGLLAVDGHVVTQIHLSANMSDGHVYVATGLHSDRTVPSRQVTCSLFEVYSLGD